MLRSVGALIQSALEITFSLGWRTVMADDAVLQHRAVYDAIRQRRRRGGLSRHAPAAPQLQGQRLRRPLDVAERERREPLTLDGDAGAVRNSRQSMSGEGWHAPDAGEERTRPDARSSPATRAKSWVVGGYASVYELALAAIRKRSTIAALVGKAPRAGKADPAALSRPGACSRRSTIPIRRISSSPAPAYASRLGGDPRRHARKVTGVAEETLTNSMRMFRMGLEGGKPKRRQGRASSRNGSTRATAPSSRRPAQPLVSPAFRPRRRRGAGGLPASMSSARTACPTASASRSSTNSPTTSPSGRTISSSPIRSSGRARSGRKSCSATCPRTCAAPRASGAARR